MTIQYQKALDFIAQEKYLFALAILDLFLEQQPNFIDAYYQRAKVKEKLQDWTGAIADYQRVNRLKPTAKAYLSMALINLAQGDLPAAISNSQLAIKLDTTLPMAHRLLAKIYQQQQQINLAIRAYKKATRCYLNQGDKKNARYCFAQIESLQQLALSQEAVNTSVDFNLAQNFLEKAIAKSQAKNYYAALDDLNWLLNIDPHNLEALCHRGLICAKIGSNQRAIADLATIVKLEPHNLKWQYQRGIARLYLNDAFGALQEFNQLLQQEPHSADYLLHRGRAYTQLKQYDNALEDYDNAILIDSQKGELYLNRGKLQELQNNHQQAIADYQTAAMLFLNQGDYIHQQQAKENIAVLKANLQQQQAETDKIIRVPIKYFTSNRGSAVVEVVFNQQYTFDLIVDTGATNTTITQKMQRIMQLPTTGKQLCRVGDGRIVEFDVCQVNSLSVQKATVYHLDIDVATKERTSEGLLGQDFLRNYEVRILKQEIHLYPH